MENGSKWLQGHGWQMRDSSITTDNICEKDVWDVY